MAGFIGNCLLGANGIVAEVINDLKCSSYEKFKNKMFGLWNILLSALSALIITRFALQSMRATPGVQISETLGFVISVVIGTTWFFGYLVMTILVQLSLRKDKDKFFKNAGKAVPRIIFAVLLSLLVTDPFILQSFESDIKNEIEVISENAYKKKAEEVSNEQKNLKKPEIDALILQKATLEKGLTESTKINSERLNNLTQKPSGQVTQRQIARMDRQFKNLDELNLKQQKDANDKISKIAESLQKIEDGIKETSEQAARNAKLEILRNTGYFAQHNALFHFAQREPYAGFKIAATILFVLFLELMTVLFKVFAKYSAYEAELDRLQALDEEAAAVQKAKSAKAVAEAVYQQKLSEKISENVDELVEQQRKAEGELLKAQNDFRQQIQKQLFDSVINGTSLNNRELNFLKEELLKKTGEQILSSSQIAPLSSAKNPDKKPFESQNSNATVDVKTTVTIEYMLTGKKCGIVFFNPPERISGLDLNGELLAQSFGLPFDGRFEYPFESFDFINEKGKHIDIKENFVKMLGNSNRLLMRPKVQQSPLNVNT